MSSPEINYKIGNESLIEVLPNASERLLGLLEKQGKADFGALRVAVVGGGCSGLQYKMDLVDGPVDRDLMVTSNEVRVVIDEHQPIASLGRGRFLTQEGKIIFPKEKNKQLDLISITGDNQDINYLFGNALALQSVLNLRNYSLVSFSASDSGILMAVDSNGAKYSFNREDFRVQLERLEHFLLFELNSGSNDHIRYIDLRYKNAIAVGREKMEKSI